MKCLTFNSHSNSPEESIKQVSNILQLKGSAEKKEEFQKLNPNSNNRFNIQNDDKQNKDGKNLNNTKENNLAKNSRSPPALFSSNSIQYYLIRDLELSKTPVKTEEIINTSRDKRMKMLILDLDETLVHSSFTPLSPCQLNLNVF